MTVRLAAACAFLLGAVALASCTSDPGAPADAVAPPVGHGEFVFRGDWSGAGDRNGEGVLAMRVTDAAADGTAFTGELTYATGGTTSTDEVHAAMTPHGHLVAGIGADASVELHITDPATLDYCFVRYGTEPVHACGRLTRADGQDG